MIKRHQRNKGWMRRTSRVYLRHTNVGKLNTLKVFLDNYNNAVNYAIVRLWSDKDFSSTLPAIEFTTTIRNRFHVTARLAQCIAKQAKETVKSQHKRDRKRIPRMRKHTANLDGRFVSIEPFHGSFELGVSFGSGVPELIVPLNRTEHMQKFFDTGWTLAKSIRLGYNDNGLFIDFIFEKPKPEHRTTGKVIGIDRGFNTMLYTSENQAVGTDLKQKIKSGGKRRKSYHHYIATEENRLLKTLNLTDVKTIVLEDLKNVKSHKRGKFSRNSNRFLSFWHYAKVGKRLEQICEELGIAIVSKNPWKTSQHCPVCGNIDRKNRSGEKFRCLECNYTANADFVGATNLKLLGLADAYSLRSLTKAERIAFGAKAHASNK